MVRTVSSSRVPRHQTRKPDRPAGAPVHILSAAAGIGNLSGHRRDAVGHASLNREHRDRPRWQSSVRLCDPPTIVRHPTDAFDRFRGFFPA